MTPSASDAGDSLPVVAALAGTFPPAFRGGGPVRALEAMVTAAPTGFDVRVLAGDRDLGADEPLPVLRNEWVRRGRANVYYGSLDSLAGLARAMWRLRATAPALLHLNSFFSPATTIVPMLLWRIGFWGRASVLLSPHGEFGRAALSRHRSRKRVYMALFRLLRLHRAVVWHSTAPHETDDIQEAWGKAVRVVERANHVALPTVADPPQPAAAVARAAFLGRIVAHKGLHIVLEALAGVSGEFELDVYGTAEDADYLEKCRELAAATPAGVRVTFRGAVEPDHVRETLSAYDALLLATAGENFSYVIAEALSVSCAVVTTPFTPWTEILGRGGGIVAERDAASWHRVLEGLAAASPVERTRLRNSAASAYGLWREQPEPAHVWQLVTA